MNSLFVGTISLHVTWTYVRGTDGAHGVSPGCSYWQYPTLCASWGPLLVCVRACSSWVSSAFRVSWRFSADISAVLMAPIASERNAEKPTSIPAFAPLTVVRRRKFGECVKSVDDERADFPPGCVLCSAGCLQLSPTVRSGASGRTAQMLLALFPSLTAPFLFSRAEKSQDAPSAC